MLLFFYIYYHGLLTICVGVVSIHVQYMYMYCAHTHTPWYFNSTSVYVCYTYISCHMCVYSAMVGLDGDEDELDLLHAHRSRDYDLHTKERILTPPKSRIPIDTGNGVHYNSTDWWTCVILYNIMTHSFVLYCIV